MCVELVGIKKSLAAVYLMQVKSLCFRFAVSRKGYTLTFVNENYLPYLIFGIFSAKKARFK